MELSAQCSLKTAIDHHSDRSRFFVEVDGLELVRAVKLGDGQWRVTLAHSGVADHSEERTMAEHAFVKVWEYD